LKHSELLVVCFVLAAWGCGREGSSKNAVARVDDQTLTMDHIRADLDSTAISESQLQQYIQRWLTDEILYREAVRRGLDRNDNLSSRLERIRRQLAIQALLEIEVFNDRSVRATDNEVGDYFETHKEEFNLTNDVALVSYVLFVQRDAATAYRNSVLRGVVWAEALKLTLENPVQALSVRAHVDSVYHTQASLFPPELWRVAAGISAREPSFPVNTADGYYVLITWRFSRQGQRADLKFVEDEIRGRIAVERRKRIYDSLLANLRIQHNVEVLLSSAVSDTMSLTKPLD
jgi:hypothetical protein